MPDVPISRFWYVSKLTRRILGVNTAALLVLVLGLLFTGQYEKGLISSELDALKSRGQLFASALAGGGVRPTLTGDPMLADDLALKIVRELADVDGARVILFDKSGRLILDSHEMLGPGGVVQIVSLEPPFRTLSLGQKALFLADHALARLPSALALPYFPDGQTRRIDGWPGVVQSLRGEPQGEAWRDADGGILLTAALPVQNLKNVLGAVYLMRDGRAVEQTVRAVQFTVLRAFLVALLVTVLFSIYLSETIVYPIVRLAAATARVRDSLLHKDQIPDLSWRKDEIGDLSRAFREMTAALETRMDAISRFAADVAHEIKNPLASVKSAIETFAVVKDEAQRTQLLAVVHDDVNRLNRLITDISNASRVDSELSRAERKPLDLAQVLKDVVAAEASRIGDPDKIVLYVEDGRRLPVTGNDVQLVQVAHNLIDNALSFLTEGGKVVVSAGIKGDKIYMHIDNAGPPIPEDKLDAVFERFYSERPKTEKFGLHSGLGLSISRQIVRMHRGEITAQNLKDKSGAPHGVRFAVLLPAGAGTK